MAILQKAISDIREKVRGKDVDLYLKKQKNLIMAEYDLNESLFAVLHNRLRVEQVHGTIPGPKIKSEPADAPSDPLSDFTKAKKKGGRPKGSTKAKAKKK